jgi:hypothetical protein
MNPRLQLAIYAGLALLAALGLWGYVNAREASARLGATLEQQGAIIAAQTQRMEALQEAMAERDRQLTRALEDLASVQRRVQTPQQVIREIPQFLPSAAQPVLETPADAPPRLVFEGEEKIKALFDELVEARKTHVELAAREQDIADLKAIVAAKDVQIAALEKQRDEAVKAAKGGGFWRRTWNAAKWLVVGAAIGVALPL